jgi:hypothetical protein
MSFQACCIFMFLSLLLIRLDCPPFLYSGTQILQQPHAQLMQLLGKTSGRDVDKVAQLQQLGYAVSEEYGLPVLAGKRPMPCINRTAAQQQLGGAACELLVLAV